MSKLLINAKLKLLLQIGVGILPIIWVIRGVSMGALFHRFTEVPLWIIPLFTALLLFRVFLQSYRFQFLTRLFTDKLSVWNLFFLDMKARYYSIILPSSVGQDILRGTMLSRYLTTEEIVSTSLFFRLTGVLPFFILSFIGVFKLSSNPEFQQFLPLLCISASICLVGSLFLFSPRLSRWVALILPAKGAKIRAHLRTVVIAMQAFGADRPILLGNLLLSLVTQSIVIISALFLMYAVTGNWYFYQVLAFIPLIEVMALLVPFAPNGAGVREVMFILLFQMINRPREELLLYIAINLIGHLINLTGIIAVLGEKIVIARNKKRNSLNL